MARGALLLVPWFFLFAHLTTKAEEPSHDNKKDLERLAAKFKFFASIDFIYDRGPDLGWWTPKEVYTDYRQILDELTVPKRDEKQVIDLLKHHDPRVRTLAMAVLFAKEDPKLLPHLARLLSDEAESFKIPVPTQASPAQSPLLFGLHTCARGEDHLLHGDAKWWTDRRTGRRLGWHRITFS